MTIAKPFQRLLISSACLLCLAHAQANDLLLVNARVFTGDVLHPYAQAVAVRDDKIVAVGNQGEIAASVGANAKVVDLQGKTLLPGLLDSHEHPVYGGTGLLSAHVESTITRVDQVAKVALKALKEGKSLRGDVLVVTNIPLGIWSQLPQLNERFNSGPFAKVPVVLHGMDGHTGWGNRVLRERAGITQAFLRGLTESQRKYYGSSKDLVPNGFTVDAGWDTLQAKVPAPDAAFMLEAGRAGVNLMHELGITGWLDALASPEILATYKALADRNELKSHVSAFVEVKAKDAEPLAQVQAMRQKYANVPGLALPGIKIFMDGVVEYPSHSAAMSEPYKKTGKMGDLLFPPEQFAQVVTAADKAGLVVHVHAIGDRAVNESLNGFAAARQANGNSGLPDTITHLQFVKPSDIPRFKALGVIASLQLLWAEAGPDTIDLIQPYVDPAIFPWQYPARSLLNAGAMIAGASDWSVSTPNVFEAIYQAETRKGPMGVLNAAEDMPREAMLYAYTINAARALNQQDRIGSIEPGKQADFAVVDRDVLAVSPEQLKATKVLGTMVGGEWVYRAEGSKL